MARKSNKRAKGRSRRPARARGAGSVRTQGRPPEPREPDATEVEETEAEDGNGVADRVAEDGVAGDGVAEDGVAGDGVAGDGVAGDGVAGDGVAEVHDAGAPNPIEHATPDAELVEAQLAAGAAAEAESVDHEDAEPAEPPPAIEFTAPGEVDDGEDYGDGEEEAIPGDSPSHGDVVAAPREHRGIRMVRFVQGSWRELQRVQWPDRRQVMQATGVVIGFVVVAGAFLGASDWVAQRLVNLIIK